MKIDLNAIKQNPFTAENRIILAVADNGYMCSIDEIKSLMPLDTLLMHIRKCKWLEYDKKNQNVKILVYAKKHKDILSSDTEALTIQSAVMTMISKDMDMTYEQTIDRLNFLNTHYGRSWNLQQYKSKKENFFWYRKTVRKYI